MPSAPGPKRILVVEDNRIHRKLVEDKLEGHYSLTVVSDHEKAERTIRDGTLFHLVILDSKIPQREGGEANRFESFAFLKYFRETSAAAVILVVSQVVDAFLREKAAGLGISCILEKPFSMSELQEWVEDLLND